jgi:hypothetical protein
MVRFVIGLAAWTAGTVIAVCVAWLGANVVVRNAGVGTGMPVLNAAVLPPSATSSPSPVPPALVAPAAGAVRSPARPPAEMPSAHAVAGGPVPPADGTAPLPPGSTPAPPPADGVRAYALAGGHVTLEVTGASVQLVTAVPDAGYSVQTWSGTGWLRVDFSSGPRVSSLIASWYEHAPTITVAN